MPTEYMDTKSRQCKNFASDPEGREPKGVEQPASVEDGRTTSGLSPDMSFDEPGPDVLGLDKMPEAHTSENR
jgi:hypothetical protein